MRKSNKTGKIPLLVILGPTASGKSALAVEIARRLKDRDGKKPGAEIISADSRQVYKGLDIGTGKITRREMKGVPHHLLDVADPRIPVNSPRHFSVEKWRDAAEKAVADIHARGRLPIVCGGTGFYISALVDGMTFPDVQPNISLRKKLSHIAPDELFKKLKKLDPRRARDMQKNGDFKNSRRLIRAIEIATALGKVPAIAKNSTTGITIFSQKYDPLFIGVSLPQEELDTRIKKRLAARFKKGMIEEVRGLHGKSLSWKRMHELGLEYRFIADHIKNGSKNRQEMSDNLATAIRQYAKRQMTWWKRDARIVWMDPREKTTINDILRRITSDINNQQKQ